MVLSLVGGGHVTFTDYVFNDDVVEVEEESIHSDMWASSTFKMIQDDLQFVDTAGTNLKDGENVEGKYANVPDVEIMLDKDDRKRK